MKLTTIFWREYLTRLKSKGFILSTLLGPLALFLMIAFPIASIFLFQDSKVRTIAVIDPLGEVSARIKMPNGMRIKQTQESDDQIRAKVKEGVYAGYLYIPPTLVNGKGEVIYYSEESGGLMRKNELADAVNNAIQSYHLQLANLSPEMQKRLTKSNHVRNIQLTDHGDKVDSSDILTGIGFVMGMLMYVSVLLYGSLVMRSVMEEKTTRIVEVIISCVKPFELMLGKVLGIGALGVTQMLIWSILGIAITSSLGIILGWFISPADILQNIPQGEVSQMSMEQALAKNGVGLPDLPFSLFVWFVLFFIGGYLLYSSMFAAVGSVVDQESDAQQFMLPVMLPIVLSILCLNLVMENPNDTAAVWLSLVPFFSPILMIVRVAITHVPFWQVALSFALLIGAFLSMIWLAGRIYRIGILSFGKRPTFKEILKWIRY